MSVFPSVRPSVRPSDTVPALTCPAVISGPLFRALATRSVNAEIEVSDADSVIHAGIRFAGISYLAEVADPTSVAGASVRRCAGAVDAWTDQFASESAVRVSPHLISVATSLLSRLRIANLVGTIFFAELSAVFSVVIRRAVNLL